MRPNEGYLTVRQIARALREGCVAAEDYEAAETDSYRLREVLEWIERKTRYEARDYSDSLLKAIHEEAKRALAEAGE